MFTNTMILVMYLPDVPQNEGPLSPAAGSVLRRHLSAVAPLLGIRSAKKSYSVQGYAPFQGWLTSKN